METGRSQIKRVLIVHERFPPDFAGGGEYVVLKTAQGLIDRGIDVTVLTTGDPALNEFEGVKTCRLSVSVYSLNLKWQTIVSHAESADLIHCFTYHSILPSWLAGIKLGKPVVCGVLALFGSAWHQMKGPFLGRLFQAMEYALLKLPVSTRIYLSDFSHETAVKKGIDSQSDHVIEPGISLQDYHPAPNKSYVLFSGKFDTRKGVDLIIEAARQLPDIPFRMLVWGNVDSAVKIKLPDNIQLSIMEHRLQLAEILARARIFVFPTKAETFGLVIAEAMASGCAIVSSSKLNFEGIRVDENDQNGIIEAIDTLWHAKNQCRRIGKINNLMAQKYQWDAHINSLIKVYRNITK